MSAHFAGTADRRRRRLAYQAQTERLVPASARTPQANQPSEIEQPIESRRFARWNWLRLSLIPQRWGFIAILACINLLAWGAMLWLGLSGWAAANGFGELTSLNRGPVVKYFSLLQLLMTAQLSFLIYWYRSRSRKDFMGRYRIWGWAGMFWGAVCIIKATRLQTSSIQDFLERAQLNSWRPETLSWLLPLSIGVVAIYRILRREVRQSQASLVAWEISFGIGVLTAFLALGLDNLLPAPTRLPVFVAVSTLWQASLAISSLIHARYVVHVTNEAAPRLLSRSTKVLRWTNRRINAVGEKVLATKVPGVLKIRKRRAENSVAGQPEKQVRPQASKKELQAEAPKSAEKKAAPAAKLAAPIDAPAPKKTSLFAFFQRRESGKTAERSDPATTKTAAPAELKSKQAVATAPEAGKPAARKSLWSAGRGLLNPFGRATAAATAQVTSTATVKVATKESPSDKAGVKQTVASPAPVAPAKSDVTASKAPTAVKSEDSGAEKSQWSIGSLWQKKVVQPATPAAKSVQAEAKSAEKPAAAERRGPESKKAALPAEAAPPAEQKSGWSIGSGWLKKKDAGQSLRVDEAQPKKANSTAGPHTASAPPVTPAKPAPVVPTMAPRAGISQSVAAGSKNTSASAPTVSKPVQREIPKSEPRPAPESMAEADDDTEDDEDDGMSRRDRKKQKKMQRQQSRGR